MGISKLCSSAILLLCSYIILWWSACSSYRAGFSFFDAYLAYCATSACQNILLQSQTEHYAFSSAKLPNHLGVTAATQHHRTTQVGGNLRSSLIQRWAQSSQHWIQTTLLRALTSWVLEASEDRQFTAFLGPCPRALLSTSGCIKAIC